MTAFYAIACTDGDLRSWTRDDHWHNWKTLVSQSSALGSAWSEITMPCSSWDLRPVWNFNANISSPNTSYPILWLSNTRDPVTPLQSARYMATKFPGSVVFGQDADGHCTIAQPSLCVAKGIREYFQSGKLPEGDIACKPDRGPFDLDEQVKGVSSAEVRLSSVMRKLSESMQFGRFPLGV